MSCTNAYTHMCLYMCIPADVHAKLIWARFRCRATSPVVKQLCACMCSRICAPMRSWFNACVHAPCVCSLCVRAPCARARVWQRHHSCPMYVSHACVSCMRPAHHVRARALHAHVCMLACVLPCVYRYPALQPGPTSPCSSRRKASSSAKPPSAVASPHPYAATYLAHGGRGCVVSGGE